MLKCRSLSTHHPCCDMNGLGQPREVARHRHDEGVEWAACRLLAELAGRKVEDVPLDGQAAHVLVAAAQARTRIVTVDEAVDPGDRPCPVA